RMDIATASSRDVMKGEKTIRRTSTLPTTARRAAATGIGWARSGSIRTPIARDIVSVSGRATTTRAVAGAHAMAMPMTSQPGTTAHTADPGLATGPIRLAFRTVLR